MFTSNRKNYKIIDGEQEELSTTDLDDVTPPLPLQENIAISFEGLQKDKNLTTSKQNHRWDHIENVDQFFTLVYEYHQGNGFTCIALRQGFALFQFIFVICFSTFLLQCVDYDILFNNNNATRSNNNFIGKRHISDAIVYQCGKNLHPLIVLALTLATCFCLWQIFCIGYHLLQLREIKIFYTTALEINDYELSNITWQTVVNKLCKLQPKLHLIINQENITPLDIYQRILRFKNYFVALVYNDLLPARFSLPFTGPTLFYSSGLRFNLEWLFFYGPWAPWKNSYALKDEYKDSANLEMLSERMRRTIAWLSFVNLILFPFVFIYQILFNFFSYADSIKRDPGFFGMRKYGYYGREKLRHFNELDHELHSRLNKSYGFAVRYMDQFLSPTAEIVSKTIAFIAGSMFAVLFILSAWDEDVLNIEHVLTVMTVCGAAVMICRSFIPNENMVYCQDFLMRQVVANIHYAPKSWLKEAHSTDVYQEFSQIFHLKAQGLVEELLSPILTPLVLYFWIRPNASDFVLFFNNNTRYVDSLGDVCSYALMDISVDGDNRLASLNDSPIHNDSKRQSFKRKHDYCGKIEMSLLNFATLNPDWVPPPACSSFIQHVKGLVNEEFLRSPDTVPLQSSLAELEATMKSPCSGDYAFKMNSCSITQKLPTTANRSLNSFVETQETKENVLRSAQSNLPNAFGDSKVNDDNSLSQTNALATSMIASLSNINPFMTSFTNHYFQPQNIQEHSTRALEMSFNALALNRMLASNQLSQMNVFNQSSLNGARRRATGYGAVGASQFRNTDLGVSYGSAVGSRYGTTGGFTGSTTTSNFWGVPQPTSQLLNEDDVDDDEANAVYSTFPNSSTKFINK